MVIFTERFMELNSSRPEKSSGSNSTYNTDTFLRNVCQNLKSKDRYNIGIITAENFSLVIKELGIEYGSTEMDMIMQYCIITQDGYVYYKDLLIETCLIYKGQNLKDQVSEALCPPERYQQDFYDKTNLPKFDNDEINSPYQSIILTPVKMDYLRRLYSQWDQCKIKDHELKQYLKEMGFPITLEFDRQLSLLGPSRTMPFGSMLRSLCINNLMSNRKSRCIPYTQDIEYNNVSNTCIKKLPEKHDLISWRDFDPSLVRNYTHGTANLNIHPQTNEFINKQNKDENIKLAVRNFLDSNIPCGYFLWELSKLEVEISPQLLSLIKSHESDNRGCFKDFMLAIYKNQRCKAHN